MKKLLIGILILTLAGTAPAYGMNINNLQPPGNNLEYGEFVKYIEEFSKNLEEAQIEFPVSGNADIDYLTEMIIYNAEQIALSSVVQQYSSNPQIIDFANSIIAKETAIIREMRILKYSLLKDYKENSSTDTEFTTSFKVIRDDLFQSLKNFKTSNIPEVDYLYLMATVNESVLNLNKEYSKYNKDKTAKQISDNLIEVKTKENNLIKKLIRAFE